MTELRVDWKAKTEQEDQPCGQSSLTAGDDVPETVSLLLKLVLIDTLISY